MQLILKFIPVIGIIISALSIPLVLAVYLFGSMFNDTVDIQWQSSLGTAVIRTFATVFIVVILIVGAGIPHWGNKIQILIAIVGAIASLIVAVSPFIMLNTKTGHDLQARITAEKDRIRSSTQSYLKNNKVLSQEEVKKCLPPPSSNTSKEVEDAYLSGWQQLLDAKLIDPNIMIETTDYKNNNEIAMTEPLLSHAIWTKIDFSKALLKHGANVSAVDNIEGNTPLLSLIKNGLYYGDTTKIDLLVSCGAKINIRNKKGKSAMDYLNEDRVFQAENAAKGLKIYQESLASTDEVINKLKSLTDNPPDPSSCPTNQN